MADPRNEDRWNDRDYRDERRGDSPGRSRERSEDYRARGYDDFREREGGEDWRSDWRSRSGDDDRFRAERPWREGPGMSGTYEDDQRGAGGAYGFERQQYRRGERRDDRSYGRQGYEEQQRYGGSQDWGQQQDWRGQGGANENRFSGNLGSGGFGGGTYSRGGYAGGGTGGATQTGGGFRGKGPKGYTRSDDRIREDICDRLSDDDTIDARGISVAVSNGEVTLDGHVSSRLAKRAAEDCAEQSSGVSNVQNNLRVRQESEGQDSGGDSSSPTQQSAGKPRGKDA